MPSPLLLSLIISAIFCIIGFVSRRLRRALAWRSFIGVLLTSFAVGFAFGQVVIPGVYFAFSFAFRRGTVEENLYPGQSIDWLIGYLALSIIIASAWIIQSWWAEVRKNGTGEH